jgi:acyl carrier protein
MEAKVVGLIEEAMEAKVVGLIEEAMEADEGTLTVDQALDWDSIALVTFMAMADEHLNKTLSASRLNKCVTVRDVITLVSE